MTRYGSPLALATIPQVLNTRVDQLILAAMIPAFALGQYTVAAAWSTSVTPLLLAIATIVFPRVASSSEDERTQRFVQGSRFGVCVGVLLGILLALLTPVLLPVLFGHSFAQAIVPGIILLWASVLSGVNTVLEEGLRGLGDTPAVLWAEVSGVLSTAILAIVLLRRGGGLNAVAVSSLIGSLLSLLILLYRSSRNLRIPVRQLIQPSLSDLNAYRSAFARFAEPYLRGIPGLQAR
jgi:O-antigen/teichoic acid export membrane protein